jgi:hypothetical protein
MALNVLKKSLNLTLPDISFLTSVSQFSIAKINISLPNCSKFATRKLSYAPAARFARWANRMQSTFGYLQKSKCRRMLRSYLSGLKISVGHGHCPSHS